MSCIPSRSWELVDPCYKYFAQYLHGRRKVGGDLVPGLILPGTKGSVSRGKGAAGQVPSRTQLPEGLR